MKKRIACVCVAAMLLMLLGGCKADGPAASTPEENSAVSSSSTITTTTTTAEDAITTTTTTSATVTGDPTTNTTNKPTATAPSKSATTTTMAKPTTTTTTTPPTYPTSVSEDFVHEYRLIVNGKDITKGNYVAYWNDEAMGYGEVALPLMAIMWELGGTAEWENETTAVLKKDDRVYTVDVASGTMYSNIMDKWCIKVNGKYDYMDMFKPLGGSLLYKPKKINGEIVVPKTLITSFLKEEGYYCHVNDEKEIAVFPIPE